MGTPRASTGTIVVGIDGSPAADLALDWAADQAALEHRSLTLVHAYGPLHPAWLGLPAVDVDVGDRVARSSAQARATMAAGVGRALAAHARLEVREVLSQADPREALLHTCESAAMVVLGSRGRGVVRSLLLGSVSSAVSAHAGCPVAVLRPDRLDFDHDYVRHGVLVGVRGTGEDRPALELAHHLASSRGLRLTVLESTSDERRPGGEHLDTVLAALARRYADVVVSVQRGHDALDRRLVELSPTMDVVVLASHRPNLIRRVPDAASTSWVVEHARATVVVVPLPAVPVPSSDEVAHTARG